MMKHLRLEEIPAATVIMKEGGASDDKFYIILQGECSVAKRVNVNFLEEDNRKDTNASDLSEEEEDKRGEFDNRKRSPSPLKTKNRLSNSYSGNTEGESIDLQKIQRPGKLSNFNQRHLTK